MRRQVIIVGAGGHAKVVADIVRASGNEVIGFLDDKDPSELPGFTILGKVSEISRFSERYDFASGIGNNETRQRIMEAFPVNWLTVIHPSVIIAPDVQIDAGTVVMANAVVNTGSRIGRGVIINTAATVDHDCVLEDYVHISPGAHLAGTVFVGSGTWVGIGGVVSNNLSICSGCVIGAGAVVVRDIETAGTYVGVPAQKVNSNI